MNFVIFLAETSCKSKSVLKLQVNAKMLATERERWRQKQDLFGKTATKIGLIGVNWF